MTVRQRFKELLEEEGTLPTHFSKEINEEYSNLSNLLSGRTKDPKVEIFVKTMKARPRWNFRWLFLGEGNKYLDDDKILIVQEPETEYKGDAAILKSLTDQLDYMRSELKRKDATIESLRAQLDRLGGK